MELLDTQCLWYSSTAVIRPAIPTEGAQVPSVSCCPDLEDDNINIWRFKYWAWYKLCLLIIARIARIKHVLVSAYICFGASRLYNVSYIEHQHLRSPYQFQSGSK